MLLVKKITNTIKLFIIVIFITFSLSLLIDFFLGKLILKSLDPYLSKTNFYERLIRIDHKFYHHTLRENIKYDKTPSFDNFYTLCTDNHGFKYKCGFKRDKNFEIAFLGDSFVEGVSNFDLGSLTFCGHPEMCTKYQNPKIGKYESHLESAIENADVVMALRIQYERFEKELNLDLETYKSTPIRLRASTVSKIDSPF